MKRLILLICLTGGVRLLAQNTTKADEKPYIDVTGTAEMEVVPDQIFVQIILKEKYVSREKVTIEMQEEKLFNVLKELKIDAARVSLSDADADYIKVRYKTKDVLSRKTYNLKLANAQEVGQLFQQLDKIDIQDASIDRVGHSKIDSLNKINRINAIKAAKAKADYLLAAIGEQTGEPLIVKEENTRYLENSMLNARGARNSLSEVQIISGSAPASYGGEVQFQKIKLYSSIFVKFQIKP